MEKKQSQFDKVVDQILEDEIGWNKSVKDKEYKFHKKDSLCVKITKIYRYYNQHGGHDERFGKDRFLEK
jgi:hypothetical protein